MFRILLLSVVLSSSAFAENFVGKVYQLDSNKTRLLYTLKHTEVADAGAQTHSVGIYSTPEGAEAVREDCWTEGGTKLIKYTQDRKQIDEKGTLEVKGGKLLFTYVKHGRVETDSEDARDNVIVSSTTIPYLRAHWDPLMKGDDVDVRFAALDRKETVGFTFKKTGEGKFNGKDVIFVRMKPSSFVIAAIVKPLIFTIDPATKDLLELKGRTLPKVKEDGKWKDLDADIVYEHAP